MTILVVCQLNRLQQREICVIQNIFSANIIFRDKTSSIAIGIIENTIFTYFL